MDPINQVKTYHCGDRNESHYVRNLEGSLVGVVCVLSLLGSSLIILIYILNKANRTVARTILVHLSLCNIGQVVASLVGIVMYLAGKFVHIETCKYQALATMYFNISGMLWTASLAMYLYLLVLGVAQTIKRILWFFSIFCYLIPVIVATWLFVTGRAGNAPKTFPVYCALSDKFHVGIGADGKLECFSVPDIFGKLFGYGLWVVLTIVLTLLFYVLALGHLKVHSTEGVTSATFRVDYKLITIPVLFTLLRVWSLVLLIDIASQDKPHVGFRLMTGIGNNAQGFVDAVIFVVLTDTIRRNIMNSLCCCKAKTRKDSIAVVYNKNVYDSSLVNYGPKNSISSNPIDIRDIRISDSPEPTTSFKESPSFGSSYYF